MNFRALLALSALSGASIACVPQTSTQTAAEQETASYGSEQTADSSRTAASTPEGQSSERGAEPERPQMNSQASSAFRSGKSAYFQGDLAGAKTQFENALRADPHAYEAIFSLATIDEHQARWSAALANYQRSLSVVPDYEPALSAYALLLVRQKKDSQALAFLRGKRKELGEQAVLLAIEAEVKSMQGQSGEAQALAQNALKLDPSCRAAMVALARDHYRARRLDLALYVLTGILDGYGSDNPARDKKNAEALLLRGRILAERGEKSGAMADFQRALAVRPDLLEAHLRLAKYMMAAGNAKGARHHLESVVRFDSVNVDAHLLLGDAYRLLNRPDYARRELEWVLAAEPQRVAAHYNLGLVFLLSEKITGLSRLQALDKALEHFKKFENASPRGGPDDVSDLIMRTNTQIAVLRAQMAAKTGGAG